MTLTDTILRGDRLTVATLLKPRCAYLGERTDKRAKSECDECAAFLPIYRCTQCGYKVEPGVRTTCRAAAPKCPKKPKKKKGLGDQVEDTLKSVGVTQERWIAFKKAFGGMPSCNCPARIEYLNKLGEEFGEAASTAMKTLFRLPWIEKTIELGKQRNLPGS